MRYRLLLSTFCLLALVAACGRSAGQKQVYTIGGFQMMPHPSLDAARDGFVQALADAGYKEGENVRFNFQNAQGEMSNIHLIAQKFVADKVDMILAIGTPLLEAAVREAPETMPVVFTAVSDPWGAGAGTSLTEHLPNVTGVLDTGPADAEVVLIKEVLPDAQRVGLIYNVGEANSRYEAGLFKEAAVREGLEVVEQTVAGPAEVLQAAQVLAGQDIRAFGKVGDYATTSALESLIKVGEEEDIPIFSTILADMEQGVLGATGWDYFDEGYAAGRLAVRVMKGESPADIPFQLPDRKQLWLNLQAAEAYGVVVPEEVVTRADKVAR